MAALTVIWSIDALWRLLAGPIGYLDRFWLHAAVGGLALYLAIEGWRHAELRLPRLEPATPAAAAMKRDWATLGAAWRERIRAEGWWRDPDLDLPDVARRLGVSAGQVSRGFNEGLGANFAKVINGLRSEAVAQALREGAAPDLLDLALDMGFSSKASFNRAFRAEYGQSPSQYRREHGSNTSSSHGDGVLRRAGG